MKKIISLICLLALSVGFSYAIDEPLNYDAQKMNAEFEQLNKIENYVQANEGVTLEDIQNKNSNLLSDINLSGDAANVIAADDLPLGVPAFWWGCVLTILGVILVYVLTDQDKAQTKKALIGCLVTAGTYIIVWVVFYGIILGGTAGIWW